MKHSIVQADCLEWLRDLEADSVDLVFGSPPYEAARTYSIGFNLRGQAWVDWMVKVYVEAARVCKGLVAFVVEGQTRAYRWSATPALLIADLHRAGLCLRKPPIYHRVGIPGSGGPDWLRNDYEFVVCVTRPGKLPWSDNTAMGHPPKWAPGGEMSYRGVDGARTNSHRKPRNRFGGQRAQHDKDGQIIDRPAMGFATSFAHAKDGTVEGNHKRILTRKREGQREPGPNGNSYDPPTLANPGNVIRCNVGGGQMGHDLAHENEAPFPLALAEFFVRSFCPPDGLVADCFSGSGTTAHAALESGRRFTGCDARASQVELTKRRLETITLGMF